MIFSRVKKIIRSTAFPLRDGLRLKCWFLITSSWAWEISLLEVKNLLSTWGHHPPRMEHSRMLAGYLPGEACSGSTSLPHNSFWVCSAPRLTYCVQSKSPSAQNSCSQGDRHLFLCVSLQSSKEGDAFILLTSTSLKNKERIWTNQQQWLPPKCRCLTWRSSDDGIPSDDDSTDDGMMWWAETTLQDAFPPGSSLVYFFSKHFIESWLGQACWGHLQLRSPSLVELLSSWGDSIIQINMQIFVCRRTSCSWVCIGKQKLS